MNIKPYGIETARVYSNEAPGWKDGFGGTVTSRVDFLWDGKTTVKLTLKFYSPFAVNSGIQEFLLLEDHYKQLVMEGGNQKLKNERFEIRWDR